MSFSIEKPLYFLLQKEPFFANFLLASKISLNVPKVPTAGACVVKGQIQFVFNTDFMEKHSLDGQIAILKHEVLHVLLDHCGPRMQGHTNGLAKNIAMDCAINQNISNMPEGGVTLEQVQALTNNPKLASNECWEYYYEAMKDKVRQDKKSSKKGKGKGKGESGGIPFEDPDHEFMEQGEDTEAERAMNEVSVRDAISKAVNASSGIIPDCIQSVLSRINKPAQLPWKQILRNFVSNARSIQKIPTRLKPHRRFELDQPGKKKKKKLILGVCTDSSGSVSNEDYEKFMCEIQSISKNTSITYLVHADCEVQKIDIIKEGAGGKSKEAFFKRYGGGGTAYQPAIDACVKLKCDAIIYFGDMDSADVPVNPKTPFLWVRVGSQNPPADFGKILDLN